jgi:hypothetical protein
MTALPDGIDRGVRSDRKEYRPVASQIPILGIRNEISNSNGEAASRHLAEPIPALPIPISVPPIEAPNNNMVQHGMTTTTLISFSNDDEEQQNPAEEDMEASTGDEQKLRNARKWWALVGAALLVILGIVVGGI